MLLLYVEDLDRLRVYVVVSSEEGESVVQVVAFRKEV
jgi:hypothetical protein